MIQQFDDFKEKLGANLLDLSFAEKKQIVRLLVREVVVDIKNEDILIKHALPAPKKSGHCVWGVLSPLLANLLLDDLDKTLEARGHRFVRYADDCNTYVKSQRAGERVLESIKRYLSKTQSKRYQECRG